MTEWTRRELLAGVAGAAAVGAAAPSASASSSKRRASRGRPFVLASANGARFRNGGPRTAVEEAYARLVAGEDPLDAAVAGVAINELDPADDSVGYGGTPNADGVVQLDAAVMHGGRQEAAGVAALEGVRTAAAVARAVARESQDLLLVGAGAQAFARERGFAVELDLNTDASRRRWQEWRRRRDAEHAGDGDAARQAMVARGELDPLHVGGTIHLAARAADGTLAATTTTAGLAFKHPGRVGDSPVLGAGLYVDGATGAAGSTGLGEANLYGLSCFLLVEELRRGRHPKDAGIAVLRRIVAETRDPRRLDARGRPNFALAFYALASDGAFAGISLYGKFEGYAARFAICDENGAEERDCDYLIAESRA